MANAFSTWLNLTKPEVETDSNAWGGHLNGDMDIIDAIFNPAGSGTGVGLNIPAATTSTTYAFNMSGVMTGTGSVSLLAMSAVDVKDTTFGIHNATDATRIVRISAAAVNTGSTRTISMIDADVTIVGATNTQTLTNKTLSSPAINTATLSVATTGIQFLGTTTGTMSLLAAATATGTLLFPTILTTDTLVAATATQTLLNKTLTDAIVNTQTPGNNTTKAASTAYVDAAVAAPSVMARQVIFTATNPSGTTAIPADNTIPQITEGNSIAAFAVNFTPVLSTHPVRITVDIPLTGSLGDLYCAALFIDGGANAVKSRFVRADGNTYGSSVLIYETTYSAATHSVAVRVGSNSGASCVINGPSTGQVGNGTHGATMTIEEIRP